MSDEPYSKEDIETALNIFQRAIQVFEIPNEPKPESIKNFYREDGTLDLSKVPSLSIREWENGTKMLNLVYFYGGFFAVGAEYNPIPAILDFLGDARQMIRNRFPSWEDEEREKQVQLEALKMTFMLVSKIHPRMNFSMRNFIDEIIRAWVIKWQKWEVRVYSESGLKTNPVSETKLLRDLLKSYEDGLLEFWLDKPDKGLDQRKMQFAKEYPNVSKHWQNLRKWSRELNLDWRIYAKPERFLDTPDDLLNKLEGSEPEKTSFLALEHAARRAGLLKISQDEKILERRAQQIKVTGYTPRQLQNLLEEGKRLLEETGDGSAFHQGNATDEPGTQS